MKGSIFKHFESFVSDGWGPEVFEDVLASVDLVTKGPFLGPENYPDEDLLAIVGATIQRLGVPLPDALRAFGRYLFGKLAGDAPVFLEQARDLKSLLRMVDQVIHVEVKKLAPDAYLPRIDTEDPGPGRLVMHYESRRRFCQLFLGLVEGAGERFGTVVESHETACTHRGDERCTFELEFRSAA